MPASSTCSVERSRHTQARSGDDCRVSTTPSCRRRGSISAVDSSSIRYSEQQPHRAHVSHFPVPGVRGE